VCVVGVWQREIWTCGVCVWCDELSTGFYTIKCISQQIKVIDFKNARWKHEINDYPKFWRPSGHMTFALSVIFILQMPHKFKDAPFLMANSFCVVGLINLLSYNVVLVNASV